MLHVAVPTTGAKAALKMESVVNGAVSMQDGSPQKKHGPFFLRVSLSSGKDPEGTDHLFGDMMSRRLKSRDLDVCLIVSIFPMIFYGLKSQQQHQLCQKVASKISI